MSVEIFETKNTVEILETSTVINVSTESSVTVVETSGVQGPAGTTDHTLLSNIGTNTHAQIDSHISNFSNPHTVTKTQVGLSNADNTSDLDKPISTATQTALDLKVDENTAITGATKTKITYDAKGLVTSGTNATTADIADSANKRYVTDAQLVVIANTSGVNTGDQINISGNAATVTTNANLTGVVTSVGNATSIANGAITNAMLANVAVANLSGTNTGDQNLSGYELLSNKSTSVVTDQASNTKYPSVKSVYDWAVATFQSVLGFTPENVANKSINLTAPDNVKYPTTLAVSTESALKVSKSGDTMTGNLVAPKVSFTNTLDASKLDIGWSAANNRYEIINSTHEVAFVVPTGSQLLGVAGSSSFALNETFFNATANGGGILLSEGSNGAYIEASGGGAINIAASATSDFNITGNYGNLNFGANGGDFNVTNAIVGVPVLTASNNGAVLVKSVNNQDMSIEGSQNLNITVGAFGSGNMFLNNPSTTSTLITQMDIKPDQDSIYSLGASSQSFLDVNTKNVKYNGQVVLDAANFLLLGSGGSTALNFSNVSNLIATGDFSIGGSYYGDAVRTNSVQLVGTAGIGIIDFPWQNPIPGAPPANNIRCYVDNAGNPSWVDFSVRRLTISISAISPSSTVTLTAPNATGTIALIQNGLGASLTAAPTTNAVNTGLALKANLASPTFTGTVTTPALTVGLLTGILKGTSGTVSAATAGTDYENPLTFSSPLSRSVNTISIPDATTSVRGALTSTDWNTFNNKVPTTRTISTTAPITGGGDLSASRTIAMAASTDSVDGYLTAADHTTFNAKQAALTISTGLTNTSNTITNNLSTGISGVQTLIGATSVGGGLIISTTSNATKGKIILGSVCAFDESVNRLGIGTTSPNARIQIVTDSIGVTQGSTYGLTLSNTAAASSGSQQMSPPIIWSGQGWKSVATASSQSVDFMAHVIPIQGSSIPTGEWRLHSQQNGAGFSNKFSVDTQGNIVAGGNITSAGSISTFSTPTSANFYATNTAIATILSNAQYLIGGASSIFARTVFYGSTSSLLTSNNSYGAVIVGRAPITTAATGTHAIISNLAVTPIGTVTAGASTVTNSSSFYIDGPSSGGTNNWASYIASGNSFSGGKRVFDSTYTAGGTTGAQTINKPSGSVNVAATGTSIVVTNSFVATTSIVTCVIMTADATATIKNVVPASGSFTITLGAAATAETKIGFIVNN